MNDFGPGATKKVCIDSAEAARARARPESPSLTSPLRPAGPPATASVNVYMAEALVHAGTCGPNNRGTSSNDIDGRLKLNGLSWRAVWGTRGAAREDKAANSDVQLGDDTNRIAASVGAHRSCDAPAGADRSCAAGSYQT